MINALLAIPSCLLILLICAGLGRLILRAAAPKHAAGAEGSMFGLGIGFGALSYLVLIVGLLGQLYLPVILTLLLAVAFVSRREVKSILVEAVSGSRRLPKPSATGLLLGLPLAFVGLCALAGALAPPSVNDWDSLAYHLAIPALYIKSGSIHYIDFSSHSNFPFLMEMLYTIGLLFPWAGGVILAKLFHLSAGAAAAVIIYLIGRRHFSARAGVIGAVVFASVPLIGWEATTAYIDLATAMYLLLAVLALLNDRDEDGRWMILSAVSLGLAAATKPTALVFIPLAAAWLLYNSIRRGRGLSRGVISAMGLGLLAVAVTCPWYIKSYIQTGNPFYPFFFDTFGGRNWSAELADFYRMSQLKFGMGSDLASLGLLPWNLTMYPEKFFDARVVFASIGPVFLAALPFFAAIRFGKEKLRMLICFIAVGVIIWFFMTQQSRYLIPVMAVGAVTVGALLDEIRDLKWAKRLLIAAIAVGAVWGMIINGVLAVKSLPGILGPDAYLTETLDIYPACKYINTELADDAKVILFAETRGFYCKRDYLWGDWSHNTLVPYNEFESAADMNRFLREQGVTHALVNFGNPSIRQDDLPRSSQLVYEAADAGVFRPVFQAEFGRARRVVLFSLTP